MSRLSCEGKIALVVGGTRGIGRACTLDLARAGATVIAAGRTVETALPVVEEARAEGLNATAAGFDVADIDAARAGIDAVVAEHGRIDILVANAGISPYWKKAEDLTADMWDHIHSVNLRGLFFAAQAAGRHMLERKSGSIVAISSVTAKIGTRRGLPYSASKGGLDSMTQTLGVEWADRGVRVNGVAPGFIATDLTDGVRANHALAQSLIENIPLGRFGTPEEISALVLFLASDASSYVTAQTFAVDGGMQAA